MRLPSPSLHLTTSPAASTLATYLRRIDSLVLVLVWFPFHLPYSQPPVSLTSVVLVSKASLLPLETDSEAILTDSTFNLQTLLTISSITTHSCSKLEPPPLASPTPHLPSPTPHLSSSTRHLLFPTSHLPSRPLSRVHLAVC